jgi:hypothetical protein
VLGESPLNPCDIMSCSFRFLGFGKTHEHSLQSKHSVARLICQTNMRVFSGGLTLHGFETGDCMDRNLCGNPTMDFRISGHIKIFPALSLHWDMAAMELRLQR